MKIQKKKKNGGERGENPVGSGQCGSEQRIEVFVKIKKKKTVGVWGQVGGCGGGGCQRRSEVFVKIQKKNWGGGGGGGVVGQGGGGSGWI